MVSMHAGLLTQSSVVQISGRVDIFYFNSTCVGSELRYNTSTFTVQFGFYVEIECDKLCERTDIIFYLIYGFL